MPFHLLLIQGTQSSVIRTWLVGYSINGEKCIPSVNVSSLTSYIFSHTNVDELVGATVRACVQHVNNECVSNISYSMETGKELSTQRLGR